MSILDKIIKEIDMLTEKERKKLLEIVKEKYMSRDVILLSENYAWWNNEDDDIYNEH